MSATARRRLVVLLQLQLRALGLLHAGQQGSMLRLQGADGLSTASNPQDISICCMDWGRRAIKSQTPFPVLRTTTPLWRLAGTRMRAMPTRTAAACSTQKPTFAAPGTHTTNAASCQGQISPQDTPS